MKLIFILLFYAPFVFSQTTCESFFARLNSNNFNSKVDLLLKTKITESSKDPIFTDLLRDYIYNLQLKLAEPKPEYLSNTQKDLSDRAVRAWIVLVKKEIESEGMTYIKFQQFAALIPYLIAQYTTPEKVQEYFAKRNLIHLDVAEIEQIRNTLLNGESVNELGLAYLRNVKEHLANDAVLIPTFTNVSLYDFLTWGTRVAPMMLTLDPILAIDSLWMTSHSAFLHDIGHSRSMVYNTYYDPTSLIYKDQFMTYKVYPEQNSDPIVHSQPKDVLKVKVNYIADFFRDIKGQLTDNEIIYGGGYFFYLFHERGNYVRYIAEFMPSSIPLKRDEVISTIYQRALDPHDLGSSYRSNESSESFHHNTNQAIERILELYQEYLIKNPPHFDI